MNEHESSSDQPGQDELLYFWALGDLHYHAHPAWQAIHTQRMRPMFQDLRQLWRQEGTPTFCISPGDIVEMAEPEHYQLARQELTLNLAGVPFYPGLGNHELWSTGQASEAELLEDFTVFWEKPPRYYWVEGQVLCVMLDVIGYGEPIMTPEALAFLETALAKHPQHIAIIFAHCPLYATTLARDAERNLDYDSLEPFFSLKNSDEVRAVIARHTNACLYLCGHTHTGWQSPTLVFTEELSNHALTSVNLSSPWYTGRHHGVEWLEGEQKCRYRPDEPDMIVSFAVHVSRANVQLRLRDHRTRKWLKEWVIPVKL
jgi:3',5'-cyclic AMP phosphodiesterase CpdA